jgi:hypothetical protein
MPRVYSLTERALTRLLKQRDERHGPQAHVTTIPITEADEQIRVIDWARTQVFRYPELRLLLHVPNGEQRDVGTGRKLQKMGVSPGYPDLALDVGRGGFFGLRIELKSQTGRLSVEQEAWLLDLQEQHYAVAVCYSATAAIAVLEHYLQLPPTTVET